MQVLMLSWEFPPNIVGGLGKHVQEILPALTRQGIQVHVVTPLRGDAHTFDLVDGATVHRIPPPTGPYMDFYSEAWHTNLVLLDACRSIVERYGPFDLIHNHDWLTSFAAIMLKHEFKLPLLGTIHATERGRGRGELVDEQSKRINDAEWRLTYEAWRVIVCTQFMVQEAVDFLSVPHDKLDVIPNGIDPTPFVSLEGKDLSTVRDRYTAPDDNLVLSVGRMVHEKGARVLVKAAPHVLAELPNTKFVIAGTGPELEPLRDLVYRMGIQERVSLPGFLPDDDRDMLYKVADCAVFPSLYEPFGIVALEAMAAKVPVVVSEVGGLREVVRHGETGIPVYPNDPRSCAWGILHTLQHPEWAHLRVENAFRAVQTEFNWDNIARRTIDAYRRIVDERARTDW